MNEHALEQPPAAQNISDSDAPRPPLEEGVLTNSFSRKVRHDIRTCLGQIIGYSELWMEDLPEEEHAALISDLGRIHTAGRHLLNWVNSTMDPVNRRADNAPSSLELAEAQNLQQEARTPQRDVDWKSDLKPAFTNASILIVDDSETNRTLLFRHLAPRGYAVALARDGSECLEKVMAESFDLILLDLILPGMDGFEVLRRLKQEDLRHIPVIMISALDELDSVARCIEMGAEDYLLKPFEPVLLHARISASLEKKRLRDQEINFLRQLEENYRRLQESERLRDDLTDMLVHDLRTPLTSLLTGLQTLEAVTDLPETEKEILALSINGGQTLLGIVNDILTISKMEAGPVPLQYGEIAPKDLAQHAVQQIQALAQDRSITLEQRIAPDLPVLQADEEKLRRVLVNLLGNAVKFTPLNGSIVLSVRPAEEEGMLLFSVRDTGEGIPKEAFQRIFEKFGQVEGRKFGRKMSSGIGLTFCKMAVEAHGGRIWVESELGQGSDFQFTMPLKPPAGLQTP